MKRIIIILFCVFLAVGIILIGVFAYQKSNRSYNDLDDLSSIIGVDLSLYDIGEIKTDYTEDSATEVFIKVTAENEMEMFQDFTQTEQVPSGLINSLNKYGVNADLLSRYGVKHKEISVYEGFPFLGTEYRPYEVWLLSEEASENEQLQVVYIYTCIPDRISINIE